MAKNNIKNKTKKVTGSLFGKKEQKTIEIPKELWIDFVGLMYTAIQHVTLTEENKDVIQLLRNIIGESFHKGEILVVDGKIISKDKL